jgi:hypothetical protein
MAPNDKIALDERVMIEGASAGRQKFDAGDRRRSKARLVFVGVASVFVIATIPIACLWYGSWPAFQSAIAGRAIHIEGGVHRPLPTLRVGERELLNLPVRNISASRVRILGYVQSCCCVLQQTFPLEIGPGETVNITIQVNPTVEMDVATLYLTLHTNLANEAEISLEFTGRVLPSDVGATAAGGPDSASRSSDIRS